MKVLLINTSECTGGAAIAASRLMESLDSEGVTVNMLVLHKQSHSHKVIAVGKPWRKKWVFIWERLTIWICNAFSRKNLFTVSIANSGLDVTKHPLFREADVVHLHWINQGLLSLSGIKKVFDSGKPLVWTMHDMWECTSICHHAHTCGRFKEECRECPFLRFPGKNDLASRVFRKKLRLFSGVPVHMVAVSNWLAVQAQRSKLLQDKQLSVIPNTLSLAEFVRLDKEGCRKELSISQKYIIAFGAARIDDPIKGFGMLLDAIRLLVSRRRFLAEELHLVLFGRIKYPEKILPEIPVTYSNLGWITDNSMLSMLYSAADVVVSSSLYETFGQTLIEAQACGCLPVAFGNSGQADIIQHRENGFLAEYKSVESLAEGIEWGLTEGQQSVSKEAMRESVLKRYSGSVVAGQYIALYKSLMK